jgi:rhodanese-related sulfurtransferase
MIGSNNMRPRVPRHEPQQVRHPAPSRRTRCHQGTTLVDIRDADEHAREHIAGSVNVPLSDLARLPSGPIVFHCRTGMLTEVNATALASANPGAIVPYTRRRH